MTTPQDSPRRKKQKARRTKQLDAWRDKQEAAAQTATAAPATAAKKTAK